MVTEKSITGCGSGRDARSLRRYNKGVNRICKRCDNRFLAYTKLTRICSKCTILSLKNRGQKINETKKLKKVKDEM